MSEVHAKSWLVIVEYAIDSKPNLLSNKLQDISKGRVLNTKIWCTHCRVEGHQKNKCPVMSNHVFMSALNTFPLGFNPKWIKIYRQWEHKPPCCPILQKYHTSTNMSFYEFWDTT